MEWRELAGRAALMAKLRDEHPPGVAPNSREIVHTIDPKSAAVRSLIGAGRGTIDHKRFCVKLELLPAVR
jgi:hypothetical protein